MRKILDSQIRECAAEYDYSWYELAERILELEQQLEDAEEVIKDYESQINEY